MAAAAPPRLCCLRLCFDGAVLVLPHHRHGQHGGAVGGHLRVRRLRRVQHVGAELLCHRQLHRQRGAQRQPVHGFLSHCPPRVSPPPWRCVRLVCFRSQRQRLQPAGGRYCSHCGQQRPGSRLEPEPARPVPVHQRPLLRRPVWSLWPAHRAAVRRREWVAVAAHRLRAAATHCGGAVLLLPHHRRVLVHGAAVGCHVRVRHLGCAEHHQHGVLAYCQLHRGLVHQRSAVHVDELDPRRRYTGGAWCGHRPQRRLPQRQRADAEQRHCGGRHGQLRARRRVGLCLAGVLRRRQRPLQRHLRRLCPAHRAALRRQQRDAVAAHRMCSHSARCGGAVLLLPAHGQLTQRGADVRHLHLRH